MANKFTKKLVLLDGHALVHRAFHALPSLSTPNGVVTNAVYGFMALLLKMIKDINPDYIAATFDLAAPTFRHEEFAQYKVHRVRAPDELHSQVPLIKEILVNFGIPIFEKAGFEADDLIGALSQKAKAHPEVQTIIMTGDLDTLQLVDEDRVVVLTPKKGVSDTVMYDEKAVKKRFGISPEQLPDFKGLKGDPSDNIPGVAGIGDKTASELVKKFGSVEKIFDAAEKEEKSKKKSKTLSESILRKLKDNRDAALFSKKLATIVTNVDIQFEPEDGHWRDRMDKSKLEQSLKDLGLFSIVRRLSEINVVQDQLILDEPQWQKASNKDIEKLISNAKNEIVILQNQSGFGLKNDGQTFLASGEKIEFALRELLQSQEVRKTTHDSKALYKSLISNGVKLGGISFDTMLAAYLLNVEGRDYSLDRIYFSEFSKDLPSGPDSLTALAELADRLARKINNNGLEKVLYEVEIPIAKVLAKMELSGIEVDVKSIASLGKKVVSEISKLETKIYQLAGQEFNISSPKQLGNILFDKLSLTGKTRKTSTGAKSTAAPELEKLRDAHPIIDLILKYRELEKLKSTYIEPFPSLINKETQRVYTTFNQCGTATGRLSSLDPNLQNIPARSELGQEFRKSFIAPKGRALLSLDYSQLELRIVAHLAQDRKMLDVFKKGDDIHTRTAAEIFNIDPDQVTANMRRDAKALNFGIIYGMGVLGFQRAVSRTREEARQFIDRYLEEFSGVAAYMREAKSKAHSQGYVATMLGRRRSLPEINSGMPQLVAQAERIAINMPIQGAAADIIKMAMVKVDELIEEEYPNEAQMLLQVHDELVFEVSEEKVKEFSAKVKKIMENVIQLDAPLLVEAKFGPNWEEMKKI